MDTARRPYVVCERPLYSQRYTMQEPRVLKPGVYLLNNQKGGTAADLSGGDGRSLIGFPAHSNVNQQWRFNASGAGFSIQSV
ncbi:hypothetical protein AB1N83_006547, partial [Pleurotus pulmonarius]